MARRADPLAVIWAEAPMAMSFLAEDWGFSGPAVTADGVAYHRVGLHVEMGYWAWKNERGFTTTLAQVGIDGTERRGEPCVLYSGCGPWPGPCGPRGWPDAGSSSPV